MAETLVRVGAQLQKSSTPSSILYTDGANDPAWFPPSPGSDKILFYDDSSNSIAWLSPNINISISGTNLNATAGAGGMTTTQEEGVEVSATNSVLNFIGSAITAADAGSGVTSITMDSFINTLATQGSIDLTADVTGLLPFANIANGLSLSVFGRSTNSDGVMASIQAASDHQVLRRSGTSIAFGAVNLSQSAAVTNVLQYNNGGTGQSA